MLNIIEEIDSEMKAFSKTSMDLGERYDFKGFMEDKMDEVSSREIPEGTPKAVRDTKDTLLEAIDNVNTALLTNDVKLLEQGQLCFSIAQSLSDLLANLTGISNAVTEKVGKDIPLRLLENGKKDYSVVFKNGQVTDYNEVFKKVIE